MENMGMNPAETPAVEDPKAEMTQQVEAALEQIRTILRRDGGDLELVDITDDNIVRVRLQGHCVGCAGAQMTLKMIVEQILQEVVPGVRGVESLN